MDIISFSKAKQAQQTADNVQAQLNAAISTGDPLEAVGQALVDADGHTYGSLKERLDTEHAEIATATESLQNEIASATATLQEQESKTEILSHGLNVLSSDQASPLKVEFYGETKVNLLGKKGLETFNFLIDVSEQKIISNVVLQAGKNYLIVYELNQSATVSTRNTPYLVNSDDSKSYQSTASNNNTTAGRKYWKVAPTQNVKTLGYWVSGANAQVSVSKVGIYEIPQDIYNKIGVSLLDADVERMFPYVDSVQHVKNPVVSVSGANLSPSFYEYKAYSGTLSVLEPYKVEVSTNDKIEISLSVVAGNAYSFGINSLDVNGRFNVRFDDANGVVIGSSNDKTGLGLLKFENLVAPPNAKTVRIAVLGASTTKTVMENVQFNLGSALLPFTPKNDSYLYAQTVLAGNNDKKDILYKNYSLQNPRWEVERWFETGVVLDGGKNFTLNSVTTGMRIVQLPFADSANYDRFICQKYNGSQINYKSGSTWYVDQGLLYNGYFIISVSNVDSGWLSGMTVTTDLIKSYFNGWKYTGDGTTHSWVSIVDGTTAPTEQTASFVADPANKPTGYKNYFLSYQLAEPVIEPVEVEGDLSIQGDAQVEVGEGVIVREEVVPYSPDGGNEFRINNTYKGNSALSNKAEKLIEICKNGEYDGSWKIVNNSTDQGFANGTSWAKTSKENFDPTATYTVTYEILDKHDFTTHLNEVKATFNKSIKSSLYSVVSKQSDIATDQSILKRQMLDVLIRLDALEGGN